MQPSAKSIDTVAIGYFYKVDGFESMCKCPECRKRLRTNGSGKVWCRCGYRAKQDISNLLSTDLDYPVPTNQRWLSHLMGEFA